MVTITIPLKIKGVKKICSDSKDLRGFYDPRYIQISYNASTGVAYGDYHYSIGHGDKMIYHDPTVIDCGIITEPKTQAEIVDQINGAISAFIETQYDKMIERLYEI